MAQLSNQEKAQRVRDIVEALGGSVLGYDGYAHGSGSYYMRVEHPNKDEVFTIRFADHAPPKGRGGYATDAAGSIIKEHSEADISFHPGGLTLPGARKALVRLFGVRLAKGSAGKASWMKRWNKERMEYLRSTHDTQNVVDRKYPPGMTAEKAWEQQMTRRNPASEHNMTDRVTVSETYKTGKGYGVIVSESGKMRGPYVITAVVGDGGPKRSKAAKLLEARAKLRRKLGPLRKAANPGEVMQACNPHGGGYRNPKITKKAVDAAAAQYSRDMSNWGEHNMQTQRSMIRYYELKRQYEEQTGKAYGAWPPRRNPGGSQLPRQSNPTAERLGLSPADIKKIVKIWDSYIQGYPKYDKRGASHSLRRYLDTYRFFHEDGTPYQQWEGRAMAEDLPVEVLWHYVKPMVGDGVGFTITKDPRWKKLNIWHRGQSQFSDNDLREMERILTQLDTYGYITFLAAGTVWEITPAGKQKNPGGVQANPLPRGLSDLYETALNLGRELGTAHRNKGKRLPTRPGLDKMAKDATARAKRRAAKGVHIMPVDRAIVEAKFKVGFKEGYEGERGVVRNPSQPQMPKWLETSIASYRVYGERANDFYMVSQADRDAMDKYLLAIGHPSVYEPGTQERRWQLFVKEQAGERNPRRSSNPSASMDEADSLYESFHGKAPTRTTRIITKVKARTDFAELGPLVELKVHLLNGRKWVGKFPADGRDAIMLCSSPDGRQLYFIGGDQALDLRELGMAGSDWERDSMVLGVLEMVTYRTEKGFDNFQLTDYYHELGEESGMQPLLVYDNLNDLLSVAGGQYEVRPEGIVN